MQETPLQAEQLQHILNTLKVANTEFMAAYRSSWRVNDRPAAAERLAASVTRAQEAAASLEGTRDPKRRPLIDRLIIESTLAEGVLKNPSLLQR